MDRTIPKGSGLHAITAVRRCSCTGVQRDGILRGDSSSKSLHPFPPAASSKRVVGSYSVHEGGMGRLVNQIDQKFPSWRRRRKCLQITPKQTMNYSSSKSPRATSRHWVQVGLLLVSPRSRVCKRDPKRDVSRQSDGQRDRTSICHQKISLIGTEHIWVQFRERFSLLYYPRTMYKIHGAVVKVGTAFGCQSTLEIDHPADSVAQQKESIKHLDQTNFRDRLHERYHHALDGV